VIGLDGALAAMQGEARHPAFGEKW
jgi:hypothetical protein